MSRRGRYSSRLRAKRRRWRRHRQAIPTFVLEVDRPLTPEEEREVERYHDEIRAMGYGAVIVVRGEP